MSESVCFRCGGDDVVIDSKAGDHICRQCGEVQKSRLINQGMASEQRQFNGDDNGDKKDRLDRSDAQVDSVCGDHFVLVGGKVEHLAALERTSLSTQDRRQQDLTQTVRECTRILRVLNIPKSIAVS